jgi:acyl carrier protein
MKEEEIIAKLRKIVEPYVQNKTNFDSISKSTSFISDLEINSAHLVDVILDVEDEFDIRIENEEMEKMTNVGASLEVIQNKMNE